MSFINAVMALGAAAFVVPLAIHLLFRSRFRTLDWGAMFLLQEVVHVNRRRMQWHQWILLALRCAIPILLALAMARPLLSSIGGHSMAGEAPVSLILVIDESRSMSAGTRSSRTVESATELLDAMSRRDEVVLLSSSDVMSPPTSGGPREAREKISELRFDGAPMSMPATLQAAIDACRDAAHPHRRIVVVSDFQENTFQGSGTQADALFLESVDHLSDRLDGFDPRPELDFLDISEQADEAKPLANVLVESVRIDAPAILVGQPVPITAKIRNDSEVPLTNLHARWMVDGRVLETQSVSVEPHGTAILDWQTTFDQPGGAAVGLSIEHADAIAADNRRQWAVEVLSPIRVWLVDGQPSDHPLDGETDFLKIALSPFAFQSADRHNHPVISRSPLPSAARRDLVTTQVMSERALVKQLDANMADKQATEDETTLGFPDLIVLANVKRPPISPDSNDPITRDPVARDPVARYLTAGGRVLFFDGDQVNGPAWANCDWLPAFPSGIVDATDTPFRIAAPGAKLAVWQSLGDADDSLFDSVGISTLRVLAPEQSASLWLRTESGAPLVVSRRFSSATKSGDFESEEPAVMGRVVQFAIPCDTAWSNLPLRPVFVPMMQQLVMEMVGSDYPGSLLPGTAMTIRPLPTGKGNAAAMWQVTLPDGRMQTLPHSSGLPLVFGDTQLVGAYRFGSVAANGRDESTASAQNPGSEAVPRWDAGSKPISRVRVVDVPSSESTLRRVAPELLAECRKRLGAERYTDAESLVAATQRNRFGVEIWRPFMWAMLIVMVSEVLWQQLGVTRSANRFAGTRPEVTT